MNTYQGFGSALAVMHHGDPHLTRCEASCQKQVRANARKANVNLGAPADAEVGQIVSGDLCLEHMPWQICAQFCCWQGGLLGETHDLMVGPLPDSTVARKATNISRPYFF